jgi:hypothetical protein
VRNRNLSADDLNAVVQRTIDRVVFLRMSEDRGLEPYEQLLRLCEQPYIYHRFMSELCRKADEKYNSGLFHFRKETGVSESPDRITPDLVVDDKVLRPILQSLYFTNGSPYHFGVLPVEILGTVYERFLGKVIRITAGHQAKIEEKPEVRKAGGVYYTPAYIVNYIVKQTVGQLIDGKTPAQLAGGRIKRPFRVLDMACGSGSFLLGAYQYLLDHSLKWYTDHNPDINKKAIYKDPRSGEWRLTINERKRILTAHIFGVDIDPQAVEVSKLSLLLKALEGENDATLSKQLALFEERALPNLADNIRCGNSIINQDYYAGKLIPDPDEMKHVNAFDWHQGFPEAMNDGGFDCIIGNPPYIPIELISDDERRYYEQNYSQLERKYDTGVIFILQALRLIKHNGLVGYISSITWQTGENYTKLREHMFTQKGVQTVINLPFDTFVDAYVDAGIYILCNKPTLDYSIYRYPKKAKINSLVDVAPMRVPTSVITSPYFRLVLDPVAQLILTRATKSKGFKQLGDITKSTQGLAANRFKRTSSAKSPEWYRFGEQVQIHRYSLEIKERSFAYMRDYPSLKQFYESEPKILIRRIINRQDRIDACFCDEQIVFKKDINPFVLTVQEPRAKYVLGILNSRLISYLYVNTSAIATKDDFRQTTLAELRRLPIPTIEQGSRVDKSVHDKIVQSVDSILALNRQLSAAKSEAQKDVVQRQIAATDAEIDRLVYDLYGLTAEEISIVER